MAHALWGPVDWSINVRISSSANNLLQVFAVIGSILLIFGVHADELELRIAGAAILVFSSLMLALIVIGRQVVSQPLY